MRTRKSNSTKSYSVQKYEFEDSSADEEQEQAPSSSRRRKRNEDADANFDDAYDDAPQDEESDEAAAAAQPTSESEASVTEVAPSRAVQRPPQTQRIRQAKVRVRDPNIVAGYFDIEPILSDPQLPRGFAGTFQRHMRGTDLVNKLYGPDARLVDIALGLLERWLQWPLLPPRETVDGIDDIEKSPWDDQIFHREAQYLETWMTRFKTDQPQGTILQPISEADFWLYHSDPGTLPVLTGPRDSPQEVLSVEGSSCALDTVNLPFDSETDSDQAPSSWMFDAGGIVLSLDWAHQRDPEAPQLLAMAVIPHSDQEEGHGEVDPSDPEFRANGTIQIWECRGQRRENLVIRPGEQPPKRLKTICLDLGRARRVQWSPACNHLAILNGDGNVAVIEPLSGEDAIYEKLVRPLASFILEDDVKATAMTWVNFNRLAIGYSDGSIALWSIHPPRMLSRQPVHQSAPVQLTSAYPSFPYLIASMPIGGTVRLTDLRSPSYEVTEVTVLALSVMPNSMSWSEHMRGFFGIAPSSSVMNTMVGFMHHTHFPVVRRAYTADSFVTCVSVGRTHPFLLVGSADGTLGAVNPQFEIIQLTKGRRERTERIRIFQHEHRPKEHFDAASPAIERGVSRFLHGFKPENNRNPKAEAASAKRVAAAKKKKGKIDVDSGDSDDGNDETTGPADPNRGVIHEAFSRVTDVQWNPNKGYGCWAAVSLGSGLVKVLDLGLEIAGED